MEKIIDARGLACPQPVLLTRAALQTAAAVTCIVDDETSQLNVMRLAETAGHWVQAETRPDGIYIKIQRRPAMTIEPEAEPVRPASEGPLVLVVSGMVMGQGDDELGQILIRSFFHTLGEIAPVPRTIIFFNTGVKLLVPGSPVLDDLRLLAQNGIEILACGTCLGHFNLKEQLAVGQVSNMYTIAETMLAAGKIVRL